MSGVKLTKAQIANLEHVRDHGRATPRSPSGYWCRTHGLCEWVWSTEDQLSPNAVITGERLTPAGIEALSTKTEGGEQAMTQDKAPEWLADLAAETSQVVFDASVDLYEQGTSAADPEAVIALALSQAYERGQESMRERAAVAADQTEDVVYAVEAIRSLPIEQEGGGE